MSPGNERSLPGGRDTLGIPVGLRFASSERFILSALALALAPVWPTRPAGGRRRGRPGLPRRGTGTPSCSAFVALLPASAPAITAHVFFETDPVTLAPSFRNAASASGRVSVSSLPVRTSVRPSSGRAFPSPVASSCVRTPTSLNLATSSWFTGSTVKSRIRIGNDRADARNCRDSSTGAANNASSEPNRSASRFAVRSPTCRMPRPWISRQSGCCLLFSTAFLQVGRTLLAEPFQPGDLVPVEPVNVARVMDPAEVDEPVRQVRAETLDVHRCPADEVVDSLLELRRARGVGAVPHRHARLTMRLVSRTTGSARA